MSLHSFKHSKTGERIRPILDDADMLAAMETKSSAGRPAVEALGKDIAAAVGTLDDEEKKLVGRWVKQVLAPRGWVPDRKGRVAAGNLFSRGTIYRRPAAPTGSAALSAAERIAAARAILAETPGEIMSVDELIADRRREFERGE